MHGRIRHFIRGGHAGSGERQYSVGDIYRRKICRYVSQRYLDHIVCGSAGHAFRLSSGFPCRGDKYCKNQS